MSASKQSGSNAVPGVAVLLTWLLPGAGHVYLGRMGVAALGFVVIEGLYFLGIHLSDGMFLEYLPEEMRGRMAGVLTPEFGNFGALLYHIKEYGYGLHNAVVYGGIRRAEYIPRPWPATMDIGTTLTAMSGVLNLVFMSHAHLLARREARSPRSAEVTGSPGAALASWFLPGLGQILQGRRLRGGVTMVCLLSLFVVGCLLAEGTNLDRERHFYYWAGQFFLGAPAIVAEFLHGHPPITGDVPYADGGVVLASIAGMLNVLSMLDAYSQGDPRNVTGAAHADSGAASDASERVDVRGGEGGPEPRPDQVGARA